MTINQITKQSNLEQHMSELCPNGVKFRLLEEVATIKHGKAYKSLGSGDVPVYGSGGIMTYVDTYSYNKPSVLIPRKGTITNLFFVETPFWNVDTIFYTVIKTEQVIPKFLYFYLKTVDLAGLDTGSGRPSLTIQILNKLRIPIPPLAIQDEIVKILNKFTELEAELEAELESRRTQYEHYREDLLIPKNKNETKLVTIKDLALESFWIMPSTPTFVSNGEVPYITSKNIRNSHINFSDIKHITRKDYLAISKNRPILENDILISMIGTIGEVALVKRSDLDFYGQNMFLVRLNTNLINISYFLHFFDSARMKRYFSSIKNNSGQGYLKSKHIDSIQIPLPSLSEQERVASILDKFDAMVNDISVGLPAELNARRHQYEYYRNKLLTFKEYVG